DALPGAHSRNKPRKCLTVRWIPWRKGKIVRHIVEPGANRLAIGNNSAPRYTVDGQLQRRVIHVTTLWWPASFPVHHKPGAICFFKDCIHTSVKNLPTGVKTKWRLHCKGCAILPRRVKDFLLQSFNLSDWHFTRSWQFIFFQQGFNTQ